MFGPLRFSGIFKHAFVAITLVFLIAKRGLQFLNHHIEHGTFHLVGERVQHLELFIVLSFAQRAHGRQLGKKPRVNVFQVYFLDFGVALRHDFEHQLLEALVQVHAVREAEARLLHGLKLLLSRANDSVLLGLNVESVEPRNKILVEGVALKSGVLEAAALQLEEVAFKHGLRVEGFLLSAERLVNLVNLV